MQVRFIFISKVKTETNKVNDGYIPCHFVLQEVAMNQSQFQWPKSTVEVNMNNTQGKTQGPKVQKGCVYMELLWFLEPFKPLEAGTAICFLFIQPYCVLCTTLDTETAKSSKT